MSANVFFPVAVDENSGDYNPQEDAKLFVNWHNPKSGDTYRLLNLEHEYLAPRQGIIEVKPVRVTKRHENNTGFRCINHKEFDCLVGIPTGFEHDTGRAIWQKITLSNFETYDLSIKSQRQEWICLKYSPYFSDVINGVEQNPNYDSGLKVTYKANDKEREAIMFHKAKRDKKKAEDIAEALIDRPDELMDMALALGIDPKGISILRLSMEVAKRAEVDPDKFLRVYNSDTRVELSILKRGLLTGVLMDSLKNGTTFEGLTLGHREEDCVAYLKQNPSTATAIDALSRKVDKGTENSMKRPVKVTEKNAKELAMQAQIDSLQARLAEVTSVKTEAVAERVLENIDDEEMTNLRAEAKRLDVKGFARYKDKEKLRSAIEEKSKLKQN